MKSSRCITAQARALISGCSTGDYLAVARERARKREERRKSRSLSVFATARTQLGCWQSAALVGECGCTCCGELAAERFAAERFAADGDAAISAFGTLLIWLLQRALSAEATSMAFALLSQRPGGGWWWVATKSRARAVTKREEGIGTTHGLARLAASVTLHESDDTKDPGSIIGWHAFCHFNYRCMHLGVLVFSPLSSP